MSAPKPTFSIVMPVRNGEPYIAAAIESVLGQTYPDFNILVLESSSNDKSLSIIQSYSDSRITVFPATSQLSIEENWARILGLDLAEYMTILGQDDLLYPDFLEEIAGLIAADPDASLYHAHFDFIDGDGKLIRQCKPIPHRETADDFLRGLHLSRRDSRATGYVMRSADYKRIGGFPGLPSLMYADDLTWYRLAAMSHKIASPRSLFAFRIHKHSASHVVSLYRLYEASKQYLESLRQSDYFKIADNAEVARRYVQATFNGQYHRILVGLMASVDPQQFAEYQEIKRRLLAEDRLFTVYDLPSRLYETVARLPYWLRALPYRAILGIRWMRRYIRDRNGQRVSARR
jgi:glycosyltransferase involved in cell wall biosynthesis